MAPAEQNLSHEEIWDDSALVHSWNDALDEYKRYHSIYRHGGNVEDLDDGRQRDAPTPDAKTGDDDAPGLSGSRIAERPEQEQEAADVPGGRQDDGPPTAQADSSATDQPVPIPAPLLGSVRDEGLKKLLMSWYYAGYYTGLYEGQRQQPQQE